MRKMCVLVERAEQDPVQRARRLEIAAEGLLDDHARAVGAARGGELLHDRAEQRGRDGEVVRRPLRGAERLAQRLEGGRVGVVAVDVPQQAAELLERRGVETAVLLEAVARPRLELVELPAGLRHADDRHVQVTALQHRRERREDLLVREIARRAEEDECVGMGFAHGDLASRPVICRPVSPDARRTRSASPRAACPGSPPRRAS